MTTTPVLGSACVSTQCEPVMNFIPQPDVGMGPTSPGLPTRIQVPIRSLANWEPSVADGSSARCQTSFHGLSLPMEVRRLFSIFKLKWLLVPPRWLMVLGSEYCRNSV